MFALLCLAVPLATMRTDTDGVPLPFGVTARFGSVRHLAPKGSSRPRHLPDGRSAVSVAGNALSIWNLESGLRVREVVEPDWEFRDVLVSKDGRKLFAAGLATMGWLEPPANPMPGQPSERTPIRRVELWTYDLATLQRTAKTVLADHLSYYFWFNSHGILLIPDNDSNRRVTLVHVEPAVRVVPVVLDSQANNLIVPACDAAGARLVVGDLQNLVVYDTATSKEIARHPSDAFFPAMSADGTRVFAVGRNPNNRIDGNSPLELVAFNVQTRKTDWTRGLADHHGLVLLTLNDPIDDVVPVTGSRGTNHDIEYFDARTGKPIPMAPGETDDWRRARVWGRVGADGRRLLANDRDGLAIWDVATRTRIAPSKPTFGITQMSQLQFLDGGSRMEVGPYDRNDNCGVKTWDVATGQALFAAPAHRLVVDGARTSLRRDWSDKAYEVTARDRSFRVRMDREHQDPTRPNRAIPVLTDPATGRELRRLRPGPSLGDELQLTRDGRYLLSHGEDAKSCRWDLSEADPTPREFDRHQTGRVGFRGQQMITVCPNQRLAAVILRAETRNNSGKQPFYEVGIYRLDTAKQIRFYKGQGDLTQKAWSSNGRYLGLTIDNNIDIFDLESDVRIAHIKNVYRYSIRDDGRTIGTAGERELTFRDTLTGQVRHVIPLSGTGHAIAFAPDRRSVAYVAHDNTVHVVPLFPLAKDILPTRAERDAAFRDLGSTDAGKAFLAVRLFASDVKNSIPYLREKVPPTKIPVEVDRLVADLGSPRFAERAAAAKRLTELGSTAGEPLRKVLAKTESVEVRERIETILATHGTTSPVDLRAHRAHEVLDILDTPDAWALRAEWAKGEPSILTATAKAKPRMAPVDGADSSKRVP